jgi:hypothetical protein
MITAHSRQDRHNDAKIGVISIAAPHLARFHRPPRHPRNSRRSWTDQQFGVCADR